MLHQEFVDAAVAFLTNYDSHADKGRAPPLGTFASNSPLGARGGIGSPCIRGSRKCNCMNAGKKRQRNDVDRARPHSFHHDYWYMKLIPKGVIRFLEEHASSLRGKRVVDLGSGESPSRASPPSVTRSSSPPTATPPIRPSFESTPPPAAPLASVVRR